MIFNIIFLLLLCNLNDKYVHQLYRIYLYIIYIYNMPIINIYIYILIYIKIYKNEQFRLANL